MSIYGFNEKERQYIFQQIGTGGADFEGTPKFWKSTGNPFYNDFFRKLTYGYGHLVNIKNNEQRKIELLYDLTGKRVKKTYVTIKWPNSKEPQQNMLDVFWSDKYEHMWRVLGEDGKEDPGNNIKPLWSTLGLNQKLSIISYAFQVGRWSKFDERGAGGTRAPLLVNYLSLGDYKSAALVHGQFGLGGTRNGRTYSARRVTEALFMAGYSWDQIAENGGKTVTNKLWTSLVTGNPIPIDSEQKDVERRFEDEKEKIQQKKPPTKLPKLSKIKTYKSFFDKGRSTDLFWNKWMGNVKSPLDITILLNPPNVGLFNSVVPYCFDAGSELHLMIVASSTPRNRLSFDDGVLGVTPIPNKEKFSQGNWAILPWSNLFADFVTINNGGQYTSDIGSLTFDELVGRNTSVELEKFDLELTTSEELTDSISPIVTPTENVVSFKKGIHFTDAGWTQRGIEVIDSVKTWPGGLIYHDNHVEVLLHISKTNGIVTCAGNVGLPGEGQGILNDSFVGIKSYKLLSQFSDENQIFIVKRGTANPYTNGLGGTIKRTPIFNEYEQRLRSGDTTLTSKAFDLIQDIME